MVEMTWDIGKDFKSTMGSFNSVTAKGLQEKILRRRIEEILDYSLKGMGRALQDVLKNSHTTDYCDLDSSMAEKIRWNGETDCPSDILFSGTIPIKDLIIRVHENGDAFDCRVVVVEDFSFGSFEGEGLSKINEMDKSGGGVIALVMVVGPDLLSDLDNYTIGMPIVVLPSSNSVGFGSIFTSADEYTMLEQVNRLVKRLEIITNHSRDTLKNCFISIYNLWYGLQIQLLHPEIKEVYKRKGTVSVNTRLKQKKRGNPKRKVEYIKRICIDKGEYTKLEGRTYEHKMMTWYVSGHWRSYKNGKKIFINGYWKGALRDTKKKEAEIRERVIHTPNE